MQRHHNKLANHWLNIRRD